MRHWPIVAALGLTLACETAQAGEVKLLASGALREALEELLPEFERASAHKVALTIAGTAGIVNRMQKGEVTAVVILADYALARLAREGKVVDGSRVDVARSGVGHGGAPGRAEAGYRLRRGVQAHAARREVDRAFTTGASGIYLAGLIKRLGIADAIKAKVKEVEGEPVARLVARGEVEIGCPADQRDDPGGGRRLSSGRCLPTCSTSRCLPPAVAATASASRCARKALVRYLTAPAHAAPC